MVNNNRIDETYFRHGFNAVNHLHSGTTPGFMVNGKTVVHEQGAAIPNANGENPSTETTLNLLLDALRAHGLIAS